MDDEHLLVCARMGNAVSCPHCGMWVEPSPIAKKRMIYCWCGLYLDIYYVDYVIEELLYA
jgi:hypothetical protein